MSEWMPEPLPGQRRYQVCESCWYGRHGGAGRLPERVQGSFRHFDVTPCAICSQPTDSGHYMPLYDREVRASVPVRFLNGPRAGHVGIDARMCAKQHDTFYDNDDGVTVTVRYDLELVGGEHLARVAKVQREDVLHGDGVIRS